MDENTGNRILEELNELLTFVRDKSAKSSIIKAIDKQATYDSMMEIAASVPSISDDEKSATHLDRILWLTRWAFLQGAYHMLDIYSEAISQSFSD